MAQSQERSKRKATGGRYHAARGKRKFELHQFPANTKVDEKVKVRVKRTMGGNSKRALLTGNSISVAGKGKATIKTVLENPANPNLVRRNIMNKGAIVDTSVGKVKITSRPGQEGSLSGVLVK